MARPTNAEQIATAKVALQSLHPEVLQEDLSVIISMIEKLEEVLEPLSRFDENPMYSNLCLSLGSNSPFKNSDRLLIGLEYLHAQVSNVCLTKQNELREKSGLEKQNDDLKVELALKDQQLAELRRQLAERNQQEATPKLPPSSHTHRLLPGI